MTIQPRNLNAALDALEQCTRRVGVLPRPYQVEAVARGLIDNTLIALDPGLGKSLVGLALVQQSNARVVAFLVPTHVVPVWLAEIAKWTSVREVYELRGTRRLVLYRTRLLRDGSVHKVEVDRLPPECWVLVTHETVITWGSLLLSKTQGGVVIADGDPAAAIQMMQRVEQPQLLIVDEIHRFGNPRAQRSHGLMRIAAGARRVIGLTGTPLAGGLHRLWVLLTVLQPCTWGPYRAWIERYCSAVEDRWGGMPPGEPSNQEELRTRVQGLLLRLRLDQVAHDIPVHSRQRVTIAVTDQVYQHACEAISALSKKLRARGSARAEVPFLQGEVAKLRGELALLKIKDCLELVRDVVGEGERVVIWCWHHATTRALVQEAPKAFKVFRADGEVGDGAVQEWTATRGGILAATGPYMGTGLDIMARFCSRQVFLELPWDASELLQWEGRLRRLSQKRPTFSTFLALDVPFEQSVVDRIMSGAQQTDVLIDDAQADFVGELFGVPRMTVQDVIGGM